MAICTEMVAQVATRWISAASMIWLACTFACAGSRPDTASGNEAQSSGTSCAVSQPLTGAHYDIAKSRFAFGSTPVAMDAGSFVRWVGSDGVVAIESDGSEMGLLNGGAPETNLPDWSADSSKLAAHVTAYFVSMGLDPCQIASTGIDGSGGGGGSADGGIVEIAMSHQTVVLARGIGGIRVVESLAWAQFDNADQSTAESFYWPEIPAAVVTTARAFRNQLASPIALAAYKAKLPLDAQGDGQVVVHHNHAGSQAAYQAAATYEVSQKNPLGFNGNFDFDPNGNPVANDW
jgi:hypothetical protein